MQSKVMYNLSKKVTPGIFRVDVSNLGWPGHRAVLSREQMCRKRYALYFKPVSICSFLLIIHMIVFICVSEQKQMRKSYRYFADLFPWAFPESILLDILNTHTTESDQCFPDCHVQLWAPGLPGANSSLTGSYCNVPEIHANLSPRWFCCSENISKDTA